MLMYSYYIVISKNYTYKRSITELRLMFWLKCYRELKVSNELTKIL